MSGQASQLQSRLKSQLDQTALSQIAAETGVSDPKAHRRAVGIALPPVIRNLHEFTRSESGLQVLTSIVERIQSEGVDGAALANHLFDDQLASTVEGLASHCNITAAQGRATIDATSAWALATAASLKDNPLELPDNLVGRTSVTRSTAPQAKTVAPVTKMVSDVSKSSAIATKPQALSATATAPDRGSNGMTGKLIAAGLAALLVIGGIFFLTSGGEDAPIEVATEQPEDVQPSDVGQTSDGTVAEETAPAQAPPAEAAPAANAPAADDSAEAVPTINDPATNDSATNDSAINDSDDDEVPAPVAVSDSLPALTVPLRDLSNGSAVSGSIDLTFDTETGQICYDAASVGTSPPYAARVYSGDFGAQGTILADFGGVSTGPQGCIDNLPASTQAILAEPSRHYASLHDPAGAWVVRGQLSETVDQPGIVPFAVPIVDSGVLVVTFNTRTGEICHDASATSIDTVFNSEIHGGKIGVTGASMVDLETPQDASTSCVSNVIDETLAILADPSSHYVELREANGEWSARGQIAMANPAIDPAPTEVIIDTTGGGASLRLEGGTIFVEGDVASEQVANEMLSWLVDVIAPVENNLNIVADAPPPSGRIVLADGLTFESGSAVLADVEPNTALALLQLANSHPDWLITIVGHTDNVGSADYNTNLSLNRAEALRTLMLETGFNPDRVSVRGAGSSEPIADNATEAGRARNRRLEFEFRPPS